MDFKELSKARYSLREFDNRPVEQEKLDKILEAGRKAPTARNFQSQRIFVLCSSESIEKANGCTSCRYNSPIILVVGYNEQTAWKRETDGKNHGEIDASICTTQMMLQAADLGLGTTFVAAFDPVELVERFP